MSRTGVCVYVRTCVCIIPDIGINKKIFHNFKFHVLQPSGNDKEYFVTICNGIFWIIHQMVVTHEYMKLKVVKKVVICYLFQYLVLSCSVVIEHSCLTTLSSLQYTYTYIYIYIYIICIYIYIYFRNMRHASCSCLLSIEIFSLEILHTYWHAYSKKVEFFFSILSNFCGYMSL